MKNHSSKSGRLICLAGLIIYLAVQGALMNLPLANWDLLPELDDSLTYALKTRQLEECWLQPCPAMEDLRHQLPLPGAEPPAARQLSLAMGRLFPVYHPLFSLILLALTKTGLGLLAAYQWLWRLSPLIFGLAFTYLLTKLTEPAAAGIALALLAFKLFPDTGLHHLVPSNLTMAGAVVVWARIISRQGWAPFTLGLSALLLPAMHPVGVLYTTVSIGLALLLAGPQNRRKVLYVLGFMVLVLSSFFVISSWVKGASLVQFNLIPPVPNPIAFMLRGAALNLQSVFVEIVRSQGALFGAAPLFLAAVALGLLSLPAARPRLNLTLLALNGLLLFGLLFYVSSHPGDVILRIWIPLVVILFGLVGQAFCSAWRQSRDFFRKRLTTKTASFNLAHGLPVLVLAVLLGYGLQMVATGAEQVFVSVDFLRKREPLVFNPQQPEMLLSRAQAGDKVLYNSLITMPYYFIHGAMRLGAVYYHPDLQGHQATEERLRNPNLRFAVTYNPTVYHPSFAGVDETNWWITSPNFHYSPLDKSRRFGPLALEGKIPTQGYEWLELETKQLPAANVLRVHLTNPGEKSTLTLAPVSAQGKLLGDQQLVTPIPAHWSGWLRLDLGLLGPAQRFRLLFPPGAPNFQISGLVFGDDDTNWPWAARATLTAKPRDPGAPEITVSFDPQNLLPPPLNQKKITVVDDSGSSVLFQLE